MTDISAAIIAAYGPTETTARAVRDVRAQLGDRVPITVYAGNRAGFDAVAAIQDAPVVRSPGPDGLRAALAACGDGPVLVLHDDVLLHPRAIARMRAAYRPGRLVVPFVNAPATRDELDWLLDEANLASALEHAAQTQSKGRRLAATRPCVVLGQRDTLLASGRSRHLVGLGTAADSPGQDCFAAGGAVAAHAGQCRDREVPQSALAGRPLLVATLIVRDEEHMLPDCLASLRPLVDHIVVVDTGSVDRTVEVATSFGARVETREWRNDFAWARNEAIALAGDAWYVLVVDADERVQCADPTVVRRALARHLDEHTSYAVHVENAGMGNKVDTTFYGARVFRADRYRYVGAVHEQPLPVPGDVFVNPSILSGVTVQHLGYDASVMASKDKGERNLRIAREAFEAEPSSERAMQYARSLLLMRQDRALQRELLEFVLAHETSPAQLSYTLFMLAQLDLDDGEDECAFVRASRALDLTPADDMAAFALARAAERLERVQELADKARWRRNRPSPLPVHASPQTTATALSLEAAARARTGDVLGALDDAARAIAADPSLFSAWGELVEALSADPETDLTEALWPLARQAGGDCVRQLMRVVPPAVTAELAARMVEAGTCTPASVETGLVAAILRGDEPLAARLAARSDLLEPMVAERIAARAAEADMGTLARNLAEPLGVAEQHDTALADRAGRTVLFLELTGAEEDQRIGPAVERCAAAAAAAGLTVARHATTYDDPFTTALLDGRRLPLADAPALVEALRPEVVVFASMRRFNRDAYALLAHPPARSLLLVPASPIGRGDLVDGVRHPEDPDAPAALLELVSASAPPSEPSPASIPPADVRPGLVSVVIPASGEAALVERTLQALLAHTSGPLEVLVAGGSAGHIEQARENATVRFLPDTGAGLGADLHAAIAASEGEHVCLLEPGAEVTPGWLPPLLDALALPRTGAVGPRFDHVRGMQEAPDAPDPDSPAEDRLAWARQWSQTAGGRSWRAPRLAGACLIVPRRVLVHAGGLDPWTGQAAGQGAGQGTDQGDDAGELRTEELCDRLRTRGLALRVADGSVVLRNAPPPPARAGGLGWVTRAAVRRSAAGRGQGAVLAAALVLSDGQPAPARATVQDALRIADRVVVLERGNLEPTELAVLGLMPGRVQARWLDWHVDAGLPEVLKELDCHTVVVLGAGEKLDLSSWEDARAELEKLPQGPVRVWVGDLAEVRIHPPTADAPGAIGGAAGPLAETIRILPA